VAILEGHTAMNVKLLSPVVDGIKDSFKLSAGIVLAVGSVISSFADHSLSLRTRNDRSGHDDVVPRYSDTKEAPR
jgi:hypothetical protein